MALKWKLGNTNYNAKDNLVPVLLLTGNQPKWKIPFSQINIESCLNLQELGYKGEIGYQTFLYSNESEIRKVFMFLVDRLPKDTVETTEEPMGGSFPFIVFLAYRSNTLSFIFCSRINSFYYMYYTFNLYISVKYKNYHNTILFLKY